MSRNTRRRASKGIGFNLKYAIPIAAALGIGVIVLSGRAGDLSSIVAPTPAPITYESSLEAAVKEEKITFEMAKRNERLRQAYLNQIFANRDKYGVEGWDSIAAFVYDAEFGKYRSELFTRTGSSEWVGIPGYSTRADKPFIITSNFGVSDVPSASYISALAFEFAKSRDELLSLLDNGASSSQAFHRRRLHVSPKFPEGKVWSSNMSTLIFEVYSFDFQFFHIELGQRKVSLEFIAPLSASARFLYKELEKAALQDSDDAKFAQAVLDEMADHPTLKYFK